MEGALATAIAPLTWSNDQNVHEIALSTSCSAPQVTSAISSNAFQVSWTGGGSYNIYRALNDPYFSAGSAYATNINSGWVDNSSTLDNISQHAFYMVSSSGSCGQRVGEFEFAVTPGS